MLTEQTLPSSALNAMSTKVSMAERALRHYASAIGVLRDRLDRRGILQKWDRYSRAHRLALWLRSQLSVYSVDDFVRLDLPWWTLESTSLVDEYLAGRPNARVFEWGSGASTLWLARRAAEVISVEYDRDFAQLMAERIPPHVTLRLHPGIASPEPRVRSRHIGHRHTDYTHYVQAIDQTPGEFDLIVIDGRARSDCLNLALRRLKPGGMIVFDNSSRRRYRDALTLSSQSIRRTDTRGLTPALPWPTSTTLLFASSPGRGLDSTG